MTRPSLLLVLALLVAGCGAAAPTPSPSPTPSAEGFYLRAWTQQALPPRFTFGWLPMLTIADGLVIDGNVAVPAIFPGPLMIMPHVRGISERGQLLVIDQARQLGLLGGATDFTGGGLMPGGETAHIEIVVDGVRRELLGDPSAISRCQPPDTRCVAVAGSPEAFAVFWQRLGDLGGWLAPELGPGAAYVPQRLTVVTMPPQPMEVEPNRAAWPLESSFADFGQPWAEQGARCATVEGAELADLLPALLGATQITLFVDATDEERSVMARPLVPGEPSPCAD